MSATPTAPRFDHVVVIMFENRSFDHLLGSLYTRDERPGFEGVLGRELSNPIPDYAPGADQKVVRAHPATDMDSPDPDPGEEYPHINTQLFGTVDPAENRFKDVDDMAAPYNAPPGTTPTPTMDGFVRDYVNTFRQTIGQLPAPSEYGEIMSYYTPDQVPVLSALARGFACFDHWFCDVPSQTFTNRSFFHAATASGFVLNAGGNFSLYNDAETIFERLERAKLRWKVYIDPLQVASVTGLIHARRLAPFFPTHFSTIFDFYEDARAGRLPEYSFIEPNLVHPHSDMHPPGFGRLRHALHLKAASSILEGEQLLASVYDAVRTSDSPTGSNHQNTLLLVTFDEHGGIFDHVPPGPAPSPVPPGGRTQMDFRFDRTGVRIPTIAVSAWVDPGTVVSDTYWGTSLIRTLRGRWDLGPPLTARDAAAREITPILSRSTPRERTLWPLVHPRPLPTLERVEELLELPLPRLGRDLLSEAISHESHTAGTVVSFDPSKLSRRKALGHLSSMQAVRFDGVLKGRQSRAP